MKSLKLIAALGFGAALTACSSVPEIASRNAPFENPNAQRAIAGAPVQQFQALLPQSMNVSQINVNVPRTLSVSEANGYYPRADIVWRGDPIGDRHQQVRSIFETAFGYGTKEMAGETPVVLDVEVKRFHSLSERARLRTGGVHNMEFDLTVRSAITGQPLMPTRAVEANLPAFGGMQAVAADAKGQTQKVRVTGYLAQVIQQELRTPVAAPAPGTFALVEQKRRY